MSLPAAYMERMDHLRAWCGAARTCTTSAVSRGAQGRYDLPLRHPALPPVQDNADGQLPRNDRGRFDPAVRLTGGRHMDSWG